MKLAVDKDVFYKALGTVSGVVPQRSTKPVLQNVLIDAKGDNTVELLATDLEVGIRASFQAAKAKAGKAVLSASRLLGLLREAPGGEISLDVEGERAKLKAGGEFTLLGQPPDEFPDIPAFEEASVRVEASVLAKALARVQFAASKEQTRYAINGVSMKCVGKDLEFAATDGRRLAVARAKVGGKKKPPDATVIVPLKMVSELVKLCGGGSGKEAEDDEAAGEIELQIAGSEFLARSGGVVLAGRLVEGSFPRYEEVVPSGGGQKFTVAVELMSRALRQAMVMTTDEARSVKFVLGKKVSIEAQTPEIGAADIPVEGSYDGKALEIAFNPAFVAEGLRVLGSDEAVMEFEAPDRPVLITEGKDFTYVVMPVKL